MNQDEKDQRLVQDLRRLYHVEGRDAQFFARLSTRLEEHGASVPDASGQTRQQHNLAKSLPSEPRRGNSMHLGFTGESTWGQRMGTLAAALFVTLLVGSLVFVLSHAHQNGSSASHHVLQAIGVLSSLHMLDAQTGWAVTDKGHLVHTVDGGMHWKDVSPQALLSTTPASVITDFLTTSLAWAALPGQDDITTRIFHTSDSGQTWQETMLPTSLALPQPSSCRAKRSAPPPSFAFPELNHRRRTSAIFVMLRRITDMVERR